MSEDKIRYDILASEALRGIIRTVLHRVQKRGLPGDHHFYITFDTRAPGVGLSKRLKDRYPEEMTIVLQHQFWDLQVSEDRFETKLSFNNVPERLVIPFAAIKSFIDPSAQFGFNPNLFAPDQRGMSQPSPLPPPAMVNENSERPPIPAPPALAEQVLPEDSVASASGSPRSGTHDDGTRKSADIVELDLFRKK